MNCPCSSGKPYASCCKPYHDGTLAPTPLALMRSRYSGYALKKVDYIVETTHPKFSIKSPHEIEHFSTETSFDCLDILKDYGNDASFAASLGV